MYTTSTDDREKIYNYAISAFNNNIYTFKGNLGGNYNLTPFKKGEEIPKYFIKNISCNNGIKEINFIPSIYCTNNKCIGTVINDYKCKSNNQIGPIGNINNVDEFDINCGNHPITYLTQNDINGRQKITYACGLNETESNGNNVSIDLAPEINNNNSWSNNWYIIYDGGDVTSDIGSLFNQHYNKKIEIKCPDNYVLTGVKIRDDIDYKIIERTCKKPKNFNEKNVQSKLFLTSDNNTTDIKGFNVQVDNYLNPIYYWGSPIYGKSTTSSTSYISEKPWNQIGFSMSCRDKGISGIEEYGNGIKYTCGTPIDPDSITEHSYVFNNVNSNKESYHSGLLYNSVKCPDDKILVSLSTLLHKNGPKVNYVCGEKKR